MLAGFIRAWSGICKARLKTKLPIVSQGAFNHGAFQLFPLPSICNTKAGDAQPALCVDILLPYLCTLMACIKISSPKKSRFARDKLPSHLLVKFCASAVLKLKRVAWKGAGGVALCATR